MLGNFFRTSNTDTLIAKATAAEGGCTNAHIDPFRETKLQSEVKPNRGSLRAATKRALASMFISSIFRKFWTLVNYFAFTLSPLKFKATIAQFWRFSGVERQFIETNPCQNRRLPIWISDVLHSELLTTSISEVWGGVELFQTYSEESAHCKLSEVLTQRIANV